MTKYLVIGLIKQDEKILKIGKLAEFDEDEAAPLLRDGFLKVAPAESAPKEPKADKSGKGDKGAASEGK